MSEFEKVIESEFLHCKGVGSRKLKHRLATRYEGVSEPRVQKILSKSSLNQMVNAKFGNKAISRPIRASGVQVRKYFTALIPCNSPMSHLVFSFSSTVTWPRNKTLSFWQGDVSSLSLEVRIEKNCAEKLKIKIYTFRI